MVSEICKHKHITSICEGSVSQNVNQIDLMLIKTKNFIPQKLFGVPKEEFPTLPRWKQIDLKKKTGLF